jgi:hypothetical protein
MATGSVPSGTILAVHLQYLLSEKKQTNKKKPWLPALKNFPMLVETNNQFYLAYSPRFCINPQGSH